MKPERIAELRALRAKATQAPWRVERQNDDGDSLIYCGGFPDRGIGVWSTLRPADTEFVCALVTDAEDLLDAAAGAPVTTQVTTEPAGLTGEQRKTLTKWALAYDDRSLGPAINAALALIDRQAAALATAEQEITELCDDRRRALKRADALTLDTHEWVNVGDPSAKAAKPKNNKKAAKPKKKTTRVTRAPTKKAKPAPWKETWEKKHAFEVAGVDNVRCKNCGYEGNFLKVSIYGCRGSLS